MTVMQIILFILGFAFFCMGYAIWRKKKYRLINNFENDRKNGKLDDCYAKRVGIIEFFGGLMCVAVSAFAFVTSETVFICLFVACVLAIITSLIINYFKSVKI